MNIRRFDPVIYPQKLWVCVGNDFKKLNGLFLDVEDNSELDFGKYKEYYRAVTINAINRGSGEFGVVIIFRRKYMDCKTIAHEASHAAGYMFHHIGADMGPGETTAYLIGWIADCCWQARKNK
jgi:hypothetical protein